MALSDGDIERLAAGDHQRRQIVRAPAVRGVEEMRVRRAPGELHAGRRAASPARPGTRATRRSLPNATSDQRVGAQDIRRSRPGPRTPRSAPSTTCSGRTPSISAGAGDGAAAAARRCRAMTAPAALCRQRQQVHRRRADEARGEQRRRLRVELVPARRPARCGRRAAGPPGRPWSSPRSGRG